MSKFAKLFLCSLSIVLISVAFIFPTNLDLEKILSKLKAYNQYWPQQKIYLHFDKPIYATGEEIWFSAYHVHATFSTPDSTSKIVYVELFSPDRKLIKQRTLYSPNGIFHGNFHLSDSLPAGNYVIRAYTNFMKNFGDDFFFVKEIPVLKKDNAMPEKLVDANNSINIQFFPEGGNFLADVENRIAFKAVDRHGLSVAVEGEIIDDSNAAINTFKDEHNGMGSLKITPSFGVHYRARVKNSNTIFNLPEVVQKGYLLRTIDTGPSIKAIVYSNNKKYSSDPLPLYIVARSLGVASFAAAGEILNTSLVISIPKSRLPSGITQITLFDGAGVPQCERLVFINHQNVLKFSVAANHTSYIKRQKVELDIQANTRNGLPASGYFSLSVYDESKIQDAEKYPTSIATHLLLTSDLKGHIEDPGYYLKDTLTSTKSHVDLLMMTHGWRRFTWKTILRDTIPPAEYYAEQGIVLSGKLLKTITNRPAKNSEVKILTSFHDLLILKTDSLGKFYTDNLLYYDSTQLFVQTDNAKGKQTDMKLQLNPFNNPPPLVFTSSSFVVANAQAFLDQTQIIKQIAQGYRDAKAATILKEVEVKAKREPDNNNVVKIYGTADATIKMKDVPQGYTDILQALQGRVAGVNVVGNSVSIRGGGEPLFLLNGMQVDLATITNISTFDVDYIDVLKGVSAAIFGGRGGNGVIAVYTKNGQYTSNAPSIGIHNLKYPGLYKAREFYSPQYDDPTIEQNLPDFRNTLYWNPLVRTSSDGKAHLSFFTSDGVSQYKIVIEGISKEGIPGSDATHSIVVK